jgi:hypothetical protein
VVDLFCTNAFQTFHIRGENEREREREIDGEREIEREREIDR